MRFKVEGLVRVLGLRVYVCRPGSELGFMASLVLGRSLRATGGTRPSTRNPEPYSNF